MIEEGEILFEAIRYDFKAISQTLNSKLNHPIIRQQFESITLSPSPLNGQNDGTSSLCQLTRDEGPDC